ncbi:hypothetical protein A5698_22990 [Mycobacterium sp. E136]|uniref:hypothetical protein n=1 Tax=Mycobacterium sp. E136 TaxID=1834125 RepID=UPI0007FDC344|nr:hypothetical protein [Mycobacterium sp. E136]OBG89766.1 hypothetical protein A5698_22990 [Mycobacterium sp. E136]
MRPAPPGQHVFVDALKAKGDLWSDDIDVYFPYDGFTPVTVNRIDNAGRYKPGRPARSYASIGTTPSAC